MAKQNSNHSEKVSWLTGAFIVITAVVLGVLQSNIGANIESFDVFEAMKRKMLDFRFQWRGPIENSKIPIIVVSADDKSEIAMNTRWPYSRAVWARVIDNLVAAGAKTIVFDIQFTTPADSVGDAKLVDAIRRAGNVILAGELVTEINPNLEKPITTEAPPEPMFLVGNTPWAITNLDEDVDKVLRNYKLVDKVNGKSYLSLTAMALLKQNGIDPNSVQSDYNDNETVIGSFKIPAPYGSLPINYHGPAETFRAFSVSQIIDDAEYDLIEGEDSDYMELYISPPPPGMDSLLAKVASENPFKDKIVFIGNSMKSVHDFKATPFSGYKDSPPTTPGVEVHANALATIITSNYLYTLSFWWQFPFWVLFSGLVWWIAEHRHILRAMLSTIIVVTLIVVCAILLFSKANLVIQMVTPLFCIFFTFVVTIIRRVLREQREKAKIKGMFGQYVPKKVVGELIANPDLLRLGGEKRRLTVLFTDVAGFTSISENLSPEELVSLLNEYLTAMTREILAVDGIIDKYEGDLIMAEFGAPVHFEDHAKRGLTAAIRMQLKLAELRKKWEIEGKPILYSRVGINTGDMIVGNMGSEDVFDYTVMGDAVNLASRLESVNKMYGTTIMCSAATRNEAIHEFHYRFLDRVRVKGKAQFVEIFEVIGEANAPLSEGKQKVVELFKAARELYDERKFTEAKECFKVVLDIDSEDGPSRTFIKRCEQYIMVPPPADWDRVFTLTEK